MSLPDGVIVIISKSVTCISSCLQVWEEVWYAQHRSTLFSIKYYLLIDCVLTDIPLLPAAAPPPRPPPPVTPPMSTPPPPRRCGKRCGTCPTPQHCQAGCCCSSLPVQSAAPCCLRSASGAATCAPSARWLACLASSQSQRYVAGRVSAAIGMCDIVNGSVCQH
jgi:hypothetical protein